MSLPKTRYLYLHCPFFFMKHSLTSICLFNDTVMNYIYIYTCIYITKYSVHLYIRYIWKPILVRTRYDSNGFRKIINIRSTRAHSRIWWGSCRSPLMLCVYSRGHFWSHLVVFLFQLTFWSSIRETDPHSDTHWRTIEIHIWAILL